MKRTNRASTLRITYELIISFIFLVGNFVLSYFSTLLIDQVMCLVALNICFLFLFILSLIHNRLQNKLPEFNYITYGKIAFCVLVCFVILFLSLKFSTEFFAPVILIPLILGCVLDSGLNSTLSVYFVLLLSINQNLGAYVIICYVVLAIFGAMLSLFLKDKKPLQSIYTYVIIFAVNVLISVIFCYFSYSEIQADKLIKSLISSIIVVIISALIVPLLNKNINATQTDIYDMLLDESYDLFQEIRKFSFIEYQHAVRVSNLSRLCAHEIKANEQLAACGGFYYRLGKLEGEPMIDNAIKIANNHCFPDELINIIAEYGGIIAKPSTKESAIVHMVDSVVTKVELFDSDAMSSSWNQNMVIYQTINELSQKGLYDESGLSMNQFLSIREKLANEDILG